MHFASHDSVAESVGNGSALYPVFRASWATIAATRSDGYDDTRSIATKIEIGWQS
jgi:hypothetical protein